MIILFTRKPHRPCLYKPFQIMGLLLYLLISFSNLRSFGLTKLVVQFFSFYGKRITNILNY